MKKITLFLYFSFFIAMPSLATNTQKLTPKFMVQIMHNCYQKENTIGVELSKCILRHLNKLNNPDLYRFIIKDENPSKSQLNKFSFIIFNKKGLYIKCAGFAKEKITLKKCVSHKDRPFSGAQMLSLTPPSS